jgi:hypothetical protein
MKSTCIPTPEQKKEIKFPCLMCYSGAKNMNWKDVIVMFLSQHEFVVVYSPNSFATIGETDCCANVYGFWWTPYEGKIVLEN